MIDRLVHHAEILSLKGDSYRLKDKDLGARPPAAIAGSSAGDRGCRVGDFSAVACGPYFDR